MEPGMVSQWCVLHSACIIMYKHMGYLWSIRGVDKHNDSLGDGRSTTQGDVLKRPPQLLQKNIEHVQPYDSLLPV